MAPHGVVPLPVNLLASVVNTYLKSHYGVLAVASVVLRLPILRQLGIWSGCVEAKYSRLHKAITREKKSVVVFPGGIAELFLSKPKTERIFLKQRKGFVKLALETGAQLVPIYFFGSTDMFNQISSSKGFLAHISRKVRITFNLFYGQYFLPIPYATKVTIAIGDPVLERPTKHANVTQEQIDQVHEQCVQKMEETFQKYKFIAGYGTRNLEIF